LNGKLKDKPVEYKTHKMVLIHKCTYFKEVLSKHKQNQTSKNNEILNIILPDFFQQVPFDYVFEYIYLN
jgi:hypothetical protein